MHNAHQYNSRKYTAVGEFLILLTVVLAGIYGEKTLAAGALSFHPGSLGISEQKSKSDFTGLTLKFIPRSLVSFNEIPLFSPTSISVDNLTPTLYRYRPNSFFSVFSVIDADPQWESTSIQLTLRPARNWMMRFSHGWLSEPEGLFPSVNIKRTTFSTRYRVKTQNTEWSSIFKWARNNSNPGKIFDTALIQSRFTVGKAHSIFGRIKHASSNSLQFGAYRAMDSSFTGNQLKLGYHYELPKIGRTKYRVGAALAFNTRLPEHGPLKAGGHYSFFTFLNIHFD